MPDNIMTPCVGICSTGISGSVCRGCKRYAHEVIRWNSFTNQERSIVWQRLEGFRQTLIRSRFEVVDVNILRQKLDAHKIKYNPELEAHAWVYDLLRAGASQIGDITHYGLKFVDGFDERDLIVISESIEKEYFELSEAHYVRYFDPAYEKQGESQG